MYIRVARFQLTAPDRRKVAEGMADQVAVLMKDVPGLQQCTFFADDDEGIYGTITYWDSQESMEAGVQSTTPAVLEIIGEEGATTATARVFDVYEPVTA